MADLSPLTYGKVTGRFLAVVADTADAGSNPDAVPLQGTVTFRASIPAALVATASPSPATVVPAPVVTTLDVDGDLSLDGVKGVYLVATDDAALNPSDFTYLVSFNLTLAGNPVTYPSFSIAVPAGSISDLATLAPVPASPGNAIVVGPEGPEGPQGIQGPAGAGIKTYANMAALDAVQTTETGIVPNVADWRSIFGTTVPSGEYGDIYVESIINGSITGSYATELQVASITWWETTIERKYIRARGKYGASWNGWSSWVPLVSAPSFTPSAADSMPYIMAGAVNWSFMSITDDTGAATIPKRGTSGRVTVGEPSASGHAATKNYVDTGGWVAVPSSATASGTAGQKARDSSYLYLCTATNTWRRVAIAAW
jgi:hypothetical protein